MFGITSHYLKMHILLDASGYLKPKGIQRIIRVDINSISFLKGFTEKDGIDHDKKFAPISRKYYFKIIMALVLTLWY